MNRNDILDLFGTSLRDWQADSIPVRAAALTFFIILPLPSLLLIAVSIFSLFYGQTRGFQLLIQQISAVAGPAIADLFRTLLQSALSPFSSLWTSITVVAFSVGGAIGAFAVLRETMDTIWSYKPLRSRRLVGRVRRWIGPFVLVSFLGLIVVASTAIAALLFEGIQTLPINLVLTHISLVIAQIVVSFVLSTLLFAIIYKMIPEARVHWRDVILAALVAGAAFTVTNSIIGTYIATFTVTTVIGSAGSLFIILLWIYILNQIALFGAEVSKVYAQTFGTHARKPLVLQMMPMEQPITQRVNQHEK